MNLYDLFRQSVNRQPDAPAILGPDEQACISYRELDETIKATHDRLVQAGLPRSSCVGLHYPSGVDYITLTYALWRRGACVVPIPVELAPPEKEEICRGIALDFVITPTEKASFLDALRARRPVDLQGGRALVPLCASCLHPPEFRNINSAFIRFSSGTTGSAKGVVLSHETILDRIHAANEVLQVGPGDRVTWLLSMSYHFAVTIVSYLSFGAGIILPPNHLGETVHNVSHERKATLIYGTPAHYAWMAACGKAVPLPSLRLALSTTAPLDRGTAEAFHERFGVPLSQALGIIEVGLPFINTDFANDRWQGVGRLLPAYQLRMEDVGLGIHLREIALRGKGFLDAYYRPWQPGSRIMPDGWFHTGDVGDLDADGCMFLRGRVKDVINVLGMKFFPQEVEAILVSHPAVAGARVLAYHDARLGEAARAYVVARGAPPPSEHELVEYCQGRLAYYKIPRLIEFVTELPRTASGKILHRDINVATGDA
jgi:long-chain acyl-CoA synthetase